MCGRDGAGVLGVTGSGASADTVGGFSNGMGVVGFTRDVAVLGFSNGIGEIDVASEVAVAGFSDGTGVVDVTGDVGCAAGCEAC
jgi:hypothetical protein